MKGIQVCPNEGPGGEIIMKYRSKNTSTKFFKNFFSRTAGLISTKLGTKHPWVNGIQGCSSEWHTLFHGKIITK